MLDRKNFIINGAIAIGALTLDRCFAFAKADVYHSLRPPLAQRKFVSKAIDAEISKIKAQIADPELAWLFENCFPNTLDTTIMHHGIRKDKPDTFVITGDIDAMWLRDSSAQIYPYLPYVNEDAGLKRLVQGVIRRHAECVLIDPYANAFNYDASKKSHWFSDDTDMKMEIHERKWEVDSLCYVIRLSYHYWKGSGDTAPFDAEWRDAMRLIVKTFITQQRKTDHGPYHFRRGVFKSKDTLSNSGYGSDAKPVGLIHSMFRPSDDATKYPFLIPSNFFAVVSLRQLSEMTKAIGEDALAADSLALAEEVHTAIKDNAVYLHPKHGQVYAYEIDALGNHLVIDEPNLPNLLSLPYFGAVEKGDKIYDNTRRMILSESNPYFNRGRYAEGVGSDHTPKGYVWHLSLIARALTSNDDEEIQHRIAAIKATHAGTGFMHEGFHPDYPHRYTRKWFAWANTLFGELIVKVAKERPHLLAKAY